MTFAAFGLDFSWEAIDSATDYQPRLWSWNIGAAALLSEHLPNVRFVSGLDYGRLAAEGEAYLASYWRPDWYEAQRRFSSAGFMREIGYARRFVEHGYFEHRILTDSEIQILHQTNYLIWNVDHRRLLNLPGACGHSVLSYEMTDRLVTYHDPGLPPAEGATVSLRRFLHAIDGAREAIIVPAIRKTEP